MPQVVAGRAADGTQPRRARPITASGGPHVHREPERIRSDSSVRSGGSDGRLEIDATRARQTERPATPFRSVLAGGVSLLMRGAEVATHVVGGPMLAAAVHDARVGATAAIAGTAAAGAGGLASRAGRASRRPRRVGESGDGEPWRR